MGMGHRFLSPCSTARACSRKHFRPRLPGGGEGVGIGEIWHNKIVPNFAMEFKNWCQILSAPIFSILVTKISLLIFF